MWSWNQISSPQKTTPPSFTVTTLTAGSLDESDEWYRILQTGQEMRPNYAESEGNCGSTEYTQACICTTKA